MDDLIPEDNSDEIGVQGEPTGIGTDVQGVKPQLEVMTVKRSTRMEDIRCDLEESEIAERGSALAKLHRKIELLEEEKKGQSQHYSQLIKEASLELKKASDAVNNRYEYRSIPVETIHDYNAGTVTRYRKDTGDELDHRKMTNAEAQIKIEITDLESQAKDNGDKNKCAAEPTSKESDKSKNNGDGKKADSKPEKKESKSKKKK